MFKTIICTAFLAFFTTISAQVAIGKSAISNASVSLEFGNISNNPDYQKGIILPWITNSTDMNAAVPGTIIFDTSDQKVKFLQGGASSKWFDLTLGSNGVVDTSLQDNLTSNPAAKVALGENQSGAPGILVLEDTNKAMVLPLVDNYKSIVNPSPGMMAYDTSNKMLCVFNGTQWTFWKEN